MFRRANNRAFTLIELLVVVAIVGILATVIVLSINGAQGRAKDAKIKAEMVQLQKLALVYGQNNGGYANLSCAPNGLKSDGVTPLSPCETLSGGELDQIATIAGDIKSQNNTGVTILGGSKDFQASTNLFSTPEITVAANASGSGSTDSGSIAAPRVANHFTAGNNEHLKVTIPGSGSLAGKSWEMGGWFRPETTANLQGLIGNRDASLGNGLTLIFSSGYPTLAYDNTTPICGGSYYCNFNSGSTLALNTWSFITFGYDNSVSKLFISVNGARTYDSRVSSPAYTSREFSFGAYAVGGNPGPSYFYTGSIDSLFYNYNVIYSLSDLASLVNSGKGLTYNELGASLKNNLVSWWDLNEASGKRYDSKGNNHLTPAGQVLVSSTVNNGNFESGAWGTWNNSGVNAVLDSGANCYGGSGNCMKYPAFSGAGISQIAKTLSAISGKKYKISMWGKTSSGTTQLAAGIGQIDNASSPNLKNTPSFGYFSNTVAGGGDNILRLDRSASTGDVWIDNITVEQTGNPAAIAGVGSDL